MDPMEISRGFPGTLNLLGHTAKRKSLSSVTDQHGFKTEGRAHIQDSRESQLNVKLSLGLPELGGSPHSSTLTASPTGQSQEDQIALDMLSNPIPTDDNGIRHAIPIDSVAHDPREASEKPSFGNNGGWTFFNPTLP
ncbi:hypothetical protein PGT21_013153 [Puccinia graminis f. sp. tritici]|uniref:Uncharacterized protein n=1 Tax=Puccinia graminis f. sp. tritici TaxID=56615 RepID=A0A5B0MKE3_PUCGR|nr:hypothetical protein PGT21_013153 [Puccinia graminis f. sp. tritici]